MTLKLLLCGESPDGAWDVQRISRAVATALPELKQDVEVEIARSTGAGDAPKASGASHFDLALVVMPQADGHMQPSLKHLASCAIAILGGSVTAKEAISRGASDIVTCGPGFDQALDLSLRFAARRLIIAKSSVELGLKRDLPFISMLSHELKSPLSAVEGYLRMMDSRDSGDALPSYDRMIKRSILRIETMRKLIGDIVDLSRAEYGLKRKIEAVSVQAVAQESLEPIADHASSCGIALDCEIPEGLVFNSAPGDLRAIISNLISNAVKYNRNGGSVRLSISKNAGILKLKVTDTGIGMTPEEIGTLTGDFARIRNSDTRDIPGSGLGLSIARRIASLYGGALTIESQRGTGSSFLVELREAPADQNQSS